MARQDFYGTWAVQDTSGTPFGLDNTITIGPDPTSESGLAITFEPPVGDVSVDYDATLDDLIVSGIVNTQTMRISHFIDDAFPDDVVYGIYGLAVMNFAGRRTQHRTAVFMARLNGEGSAPTGQTVETLPFTGNFIVGTTTGAQFGKHSRVRIVPGPGSGQYLMTVTTAAEHVVCRDVPMTFDPATCSLEGQDGEALGAPIRFQVSMWEGSHSGKTQRFIHGVSVIGDPEEAGAWGGGDDGNPPRLPPG